MRLQFLILLQIFDWSFESGKGYETQNLKTNLYLPDFICPAGTSSTSITVEEGNSFSYNTNPGGAAKYVTGYQNLQEKASLLCIGIKIEWTAV